LRIGNGEANTSVIIFTPYDISSRRARRVSFFIRNQWYCEAPLAIPEPLKHSTIPLGFEASVQYSAWDAAKSNAWSGSQQIGLRPWQATLGQVRFSRGALGAMQPLLGRKSHVLT